MAKDGTKRGRPPGTPNKATAYRQEQIAASGITPLSVMIDRMRFHYAAASKAQQAGDDKTMTEHIDAAGLAARDAAPYVHPRLSAVLLNATVKHAYEGMNADDLRAHIARENAALGISTAPLASTNGTGKPH